MSSHNGNQFLDLPYPRINVKKIRNNRKCTKAKIVASCIRHITFSNRALSDFSKALQ